MIEQGEIFYADLYEAGRRPVLVVSREALNRGRYVTVVAFTTARLVQRRSLPSCVFFRGGEFGLAADCVAQCDTISSIHMEQLDLMHGAIGRLDDLALRNIVGAIGHVIGAECEPAE
jgi:mRNA-degrading endonuclease toxin of MazEF toxin-antitoxin module